MSVTTRSMMDRGLQNDVSSVPPPSLFPTCLSDIHKTRTTTTTSSSSLILSALSFRLFTVDVEYLGGASNRMNHLLNHLQEYYVEFKTWHQLNFEVPAGFHLDGNIQDFLLDATLSLQQQSLIYFYDSALFIYCRFTQFTVEICGGSTKVHMWNLNILIRHLCQCCKEFPTKRQLNFEVPAGLPQENDFQHAMRDATIIYTLFSVGNSIPIMNARLSSVSNPNSVTDNISNNRVPIF
jgi:hypothetical protein